MMVVSPLGVKMMVVGGRCFMMLLMLPSDLVWCCMMLVWGDLHGPHVLDV